MNWEVVWDEWIKSWKIIDPIGKPSEEGTQSYALIATCQSRLMADIIVNAYDFWVVNLEKKLKEE